MKTIITLLLIIVCLNSFGQQAPPQGINYQAVVYSDNSNQNPGLDAPGQVLGNESIGVRFTIYSGSATGTEVYQETYFTTTDEFGLFSLIIGQGTQASINPFNAINWGTGLHFLKVEIDKSGGTTYLDMGTLQMWSVPYALYTKYAERAGNGISDVIDNGNGTITFNYYDGSSYTTGNLVGAQGPTGLTGAAGINGNNGIDGANGNDGINGLSAYEVWISLGNIGTETDFINSLIGAQGATGAVGLTGPAGSNGINGTPGATGPAGPTGLTGAAGAAGSNILSNMTVYPNSGTYTFVIPAGVTKICIEVWGAGGGGGNSSATVTGSCSSGSGGGYGKEIFSVTPGTAYSVVVGIGGTASGGNGGSSSFGALISATGGQGGLNLGSSPFFFPNGGTSSAAFNVTGQAGIIGYGANATAAAGGGSFGSFGGRAGANGLLASPGNSPGGGGASGCGFAGFTTGAAGAVGRVVVWY
jgi:hypothetical protein